MNNLSPSLNTARALGVGLYGVLYLIMGIWLLRRGCAQRPFLRWRRRFWRGRQVATFRLSGRIPLGIFLLFASWRNLDVTQARLRFGPGPEASRVVNDWDSVGLVLVGAIFGIWSAIRFLRNDVGDPHEE